MYLFMDTETSGLPRQNLKMDHPDQARVVQVAFLLADANGNSISEFSSLIRIENKFVISESAANIHGFTNELCDQYGVAPKTMLGLFGHLSQRAHAIIAHNLSFDEGMMEIESYCAGVAYPEFNKKICTMLATKEICAIPPTQKMKMAGFNDYKNPRLEEAYRIICDKEIGNDAHDAMVDARACKEIFFKLKEKGIINV